MVSLTRGRVIAQPTIIPRPEHNVSRANISNAALKVLYGLKDAGFRACLVGGGVRDLLLGHQPKDFDVATDAEPEQVRAVFGRQARLIGRRFRIVHVRFGREIIEVSTFRANLSEMDSEDVDDAHHHLDDSGRILRDNVWGDIGEDACRRDFTINGLYYDISDYSIYDYADGMADVAARRLRLIGDPETRYREDPVRMLRAVRIATKLDLDIEEATAAPIRQLAGLLQDVPAARLFDEVLKLLMMPRGAEAFDSMCAYGLFAPLFPATDACLNAPGGDADAALIRRAVANTAERMRIGKPVTPFFLYAALLWAPVRQRRDRLTGKEHSLAQAQTIAQREVLAEQVQRVSIPKRFSVPMREMWQLQPRFHRRRGKAPARLMSHPRFRAAYDLLLLRAEVGEEPEELAQWWTDIQEEPASVQTAQPPAPRRRRRRGGRRRSGGNQNKS